MVEVKFLGSGNAFCPQGRLHSLVLIDNKILVDVPPTIIPQLKRENISPADINTLLITHWHGDHIFGFPFFILERKFISDRNGDYHLNVHLHKGGKEKLEHVCELAFPGTLIDALKERVTFCETPLGDVINCPDWKYERFEVQHVPETDPHGYELKHVSGLILLHCGDSGPCNEIEIRASRAHVVIIELGVPDEVPTEMHFKPSTLKRLANDNPNTIFLATHLYTNNHEEITNLPDNVIQVQDGDIFDINDQQQIRKIS